MGGLILRRGGPYLDVQMLARVEGGTSARLAQSSLRHMIDAAHIRAYRATQRIDLRNKHSAAITSSRKRGNVGRKRLQHRERVEVRWADLQDTGNVTLGKGPWMCS